MPGVKPVKEYKPDTSVVVEATAVKLPSSKTTTTPGMPGSAMGVPCTPSLLVSTNTRSPKLAVGR